MPFNWLRRKQKPWPPIGEQPYLEKMWEWAAWYSGDPLMLHQTYATRLPHHGKGSFWRKLEDNERITKVHVPLAGDIAGVSADLLFSESPEVSIAEAHEENADPSAVATQERIDEILRECDAFSTFVEGAESGAALGGHYLKINWDTDFKPFPMPSVVQADAAIPQFRWGYLQGVTFFRVVERSQDSGKVWRHLEIHTKENGRGWILNQLWEGTDSNLGTQRPLNNHPATEHLESGIDTRIDDILVRYIPNKLPNRLWRDHYLGNSDYQGVEGLLDSLDETYTSWIRDLNLAKARIEVPEQWLSYDSAGNPRFDIDRSVYVAVNVPPEGHDNLPAAHQFEIRSQQHKETALELMDRIITSAGYSPQSFGLKIEGRAESGTALRLRERKSMKTRAKKEHYFRSPLEDILHLLLKVDYEHFGNNEIDPDLRPRVKFADSVQEDTSELAQSVAQIAQAEAASVETKVRMLHPEWSNAEVEQEVERIQQENGMMVDDPEMRV